MKKRYLFFWVFCVFLFCYPVFAEEIEIRGIVVDAKYGEPLPGANVFIKGTTVGTATDVKGEFKFIYDVKQEFELIVKFMGFKIHTQKFSPSDNLSALRFALIEDVFLGEEVVVTGVASKREKSISEVAVARVSAAQLTEVNSYQDVSKMIAGKVAGVYIKDPSGNIGSGIRFNVRSGGGLNGNEQPLIIIDGVKVDDATIGTGLGGQQIGMLANLEPEQIENIEILKGPAGAASYGTNGSNGVVLITTKRGKLLSSGGKGISINYKMVTGYNTVAKKYTEDMVLTHKRANAIFEDGPIKQHTIDATGGNNILKYYVGFSNRSENGILPNNLMDRSTFRVNVDAVPNEKLSMRISSSYSSSEFLRPPNDDNIGGWIGMVALVPNPYMITDSAAIRNLHNSFKGNQFQGSLNMQYLLMDGLTLSATAGMDQNYTREDRLFPQNFSYPYGFPNGRKQIRNRKNTQWTYELNASYVYNPIENLNITSIIGSQIYDRRNTLVWFERYNYPTELITDIGAAADESEADESKLHGRSAGIFTTHAFSYKDQYFMTLLLRKDYASTVGIEAPSIIYPGISFATRLDRYGFFSKMFNMMKIRAAYGETGQLPGIVDGIDILWGAQRSGYGVGAWIENNGNNKIEPERIKELEFGFDAELFTNYYFEFTYYKQNAENSIIDFWNAPSTGRTATAVPTNIGKIDGWGIESLVQAKFNLGRKFALDLSMTNNYQENEVKSIGGAQPIYDGWWNYNIIKEGLPKHAFFTEEVIGAEFNSDGTYKGAKLANNGEKVFMGTPTPKYTGSFALNLRAFKNLRINAVAEWATGHKVVNWTKRWAIYMGWTSGLGANDKRFRELEDLLAQPDNNGDPRNWYDNIQPLDPGTSAYNAAAEEFAKKDAFYASNFIEKGDFLKIREISISYSFKDLIPKLLANSPVADFTVGLSGANLFTFTGYKGSDPEVNMGGARTLTRGFDFLTLQHPRTYKLWISLGL